MNVYVNLDKIPITLDALVSQKLEEKKLPICMGSMILPILKQVQEFDDTEILVSADSISTDICTDTDLAFITERSEAAIAGKVLTTRGLQKILAFKDTKAELFANQCVKCLECKHSDICNKLTINVLLTLNLLGSAK